MSKPLRFLKVDPKRIALILRQTEQYLKAKALNNPQRPTVPEGKSIH